MGLGNTLPGLHHMLRGILPKNIFFKGIFILHHHWSWKRTNFLAWSFGNINIISFKIIERSPLWWGWGRRTRASAQGWGWGQDPGWASRNLRITEDSNHLPYTNSFMWCFYCLKAAEFQCSQTTSSFLAKDAAQVVFHCIQPTRSKSRTKCWHFSVLMWFL